MKHSWWFRGLTLLIVTASAIAAVTGVVSLQLFHVHAAPDGPALTVTANADRHTISRDIYGMNSYGVDVAFASELHIPVQRWGGDATSRYNWQVDSSNAGFDWYFMGGSGQSNPVPSASADQFVDNNKAAGSKSLLTVPMLPYINKSSAWNCSFPVSVYGQQDATNPFVHPNGDTCGNSLKPDKSQINDTNIDLNNVPNSPQFQQQWLQHLTGKYGKAAQGGVNIYQLDNEPSGWGNTHRDIHPGATGYDELVNVSTQYAAMIKSTDPTGAIDGPGDFGYAAYVGAGKPGDDAKSHGVGFAEYYLQQMHAYEQQHGTRLLDYFDEHYYPASNGACLANCPVGDASTQAERLQSTRSLWDPTYKDNSWIGQWNPPIQLIPTLKKWVQQDYPGTKVAITEYNWGGLESINGALTEADVLGIFGREGLDLATMWGAPKSSDPGAYAFRMYLNYDGKGSAYGETSVHASSTNQGQLALYGAQRSSDGALTLIIINKTAGDLSSSLALSGFNPGSTAQVYNYSSANLQKIVRQSDLNVGSTGFTTTYPANSITLVVIPKSGTTLSGGSNPGNPAQNTTANPKSNQVSKVPAHPVIMAPPQLNNKSTSLNGNHKAANFDLRGNSYPTELLKQAGFTSNATIKVHDAVFVWPGVAQGAPDNWQANGQSIPIESKGKTLAFLGSSTNGPSSGTATIVYTDGSTQNFTLAFSDWTLNGNRSKPIKENEIVAQFKYRYTRSGQQDHKPTIFYTATSLDPNKTVENVILPSHITKGQMHIFSISIIA